ncbi:MAG: hypothetical protein JO044_00370 [Mycobacteriaceae bacterium]|nr:hypothetical protein [Mycobacteriaceae bacterium]MBV9639684.1 hypothetical protein [Mycobacteriaceae bacterium]
MAVPLAGLAWADPAPNPTPPPATGANGQGSTNSNPSAVPDANPQGPTTPGSPAVPAANGQGPTCVVGQNAPAPTPSANGTQGPSGTADWRQVATLQGPVASDLGLPPGQVVKVFCAPAGTPNPSVQPTGFENSGQPGQPGPQNPPLPPPAPTGPQNQAPGQQ